jgi:hypothetical protein
VLQRTATGTGDRNVRRIKQEGKKRNSVASTSSVFQTHNVCTPKKTVTGLDNTEICGR